MIVIDAEKIQLFVLHNGRFSVQMICQQQKHDFFVRFSFKTRKFSMCLSAWVPYKIEVRKLMHSQVIKNADRTRVATLSTPFVRHASYA